MWDTLSKFWNMGIQSFLIFGDNCRIFLKDMGYFLKKLMGYGILGPPPPFQGLIDGQVSSQWNKITFHSATKSLRRNECSNPETVLSTTCERQGVLWHDGWINMRNIMRKPAFCIYENKGADQLRGNHAKFQAST